MAKSTKILVAVHKLTGGTPKERIVVEGGEELTDAKVKALGLKGDDVAALLAQGKIAEIDVMAADDPAATADIEAKLAAETKRADDAEAKVKDLETKLAAAEKAAKPAPAQ